MEEYIPKELPEHPKGKWNGIDYRYYKQPKMKCDNCGSKYFKCIGVQKIESSEGKREDSMWLCKTCGNPKSITKEK